MRYEIAMTEDGSKMDRLQAEVVAAHTRLDSMGERIGSIETSLRDMALDLKRLVQREPSKLPLVGQVVVLGVVLTILSLVVAPLYSNQARMEHKLADHDDGHPQWVKRDLDGIDRRLTEKIVTVDKAHAAEHVEQEDDIERLRESDRLFERRIDELSKVVTRHDTIAEERTARFIRVIEEGEKRQLDQNEAMKRELGTRIGALEGRIVGKSQEGFHQQNWKTQAVPWLERIERDVRVLKGSGG